ncbi:outer membrane beta-barrel protein [Capnocytophaga felis]|uniref:Outer membrane protein beta-barrel domain-containing protein n=1 Tax=Capnocytophaga felis TaxID=2267611 RepID=A0A5M4B5B3_9FLAO|nr:outer membrane beta-barrel protein [Capnocytophaga felis]GET44719.1 hypothetical protein RCZ01_00210 [Capnocytophaga felis]GET49686.1 hypothetical protein RCZ02_25170 [Capnocytophaga felis]
MKRNFLLAVAAIFGATVYGQTYVSVSGGYGFEAHKKKVGEEVALTGVSSDLEGSFGAGFQTQLRGGYFFNKRWGAELAVGYLHGKEVKTSKTPVSESISKSSVFGASLSAVFNVTENIYLRAGGVTKVGGSSEINTNINLTPFSMPAKATVTSKTSGKMPFGFIGGLGYRFKLTEKLSFFVEGEYINISVAPDKLKLDNFNGTFGGKNVSSKEFLGNVNTTLERLSASPSPQHKALVEKAKPLVTKLSTLLQEDEVSVANQDKSPYSSIGFNFGFTFHF